MLEEGTDPLENDPEGLFKEWYKQTSIENAPDYIFIQLKRFEYQKSKMAVEKISTEIEFPKDRILDIQTTTHEEPLKYEIVSYINHEGDQANTGHYNSLVKSSKDNNWYNCDDREAIKVDDLSKIRSTAYIVVLKKYK